MTELPNLSTTSQSNHRDIFAGGSEMGRLMRSMNWAETELGPENHWSQSLRTAVSICLNSRFPILIWWGPELIMLYNDAYRPVLGSTKHPKAMGQRGRECWPEIWDIIGPMLEGVLTYGQATWSEDQLLMLDRNGYLEECYFTFSYSPIHDENGIGGVFTAVTETTGRVVSERRMRILAELSTHFSSVKSEEQICRLAVQILAQNVQDLPFAALYRINPDGQSLRLIEQTGLDSDSSQSPAFFERALKVKQGTGLWPLPEILPAEQYTTDGSLPASFGLGAEGRGIEPISHMAVLPIGGMQAPFGFLVIGLSPYRPLDEDYRDFLSLVTGQIASGLTTAHAFEEERRRAEALAELDKAKTEFFSNVSHEFRTPLTLMLGPLQDALQQPGSGLSSDNRERLEIVYRNGLRLSKLVNTLLDFSRIEAGRLRATYQPVDLAAVTADLASVFRSTIEQAGLRLIVNCTPLPEPIYVDVEMWEKIVLNLLSNAYKYTFEGLISVDLEWKGRQVELRVTDTGTGIAASELPLIFDRFHRVQGSRARTMEGSGIGLALVKELVDLHGGSVAVSSEPGKGSTFCVSLPGGLAHLPPGQVRSVPASAPNKLSALPFVEEARRWLPAIPIVSNALMEGNLPFAVEPALDSDASQFRRDPAEVPYILLADDNADMREYLRRMLSKRWRVETVGDGQAALNVVSARKPDLVLADVMMPGMDGFELLRRLRADHGTRDLPIILVSARAGEEARVEGLERGADDYLVKPFSARELIARVEACLALAAMRNETQQRITAILESLTDAFWAVDHDWSITYANQQAAHHMGVDARHISGLRLLPFLQNTLTDSEQRILEQAMQERKTISFEHIQADAKTWYEYRVYPYEAGLAIYAADITKRKTSAEAMRQLEIQRNLLEFREKERQEIARDIHDGPIQSLVSTIFNAQFAKEAVQDPLAQAEFEQIGHSLKYAVRELRDVVNELRPPALIHFGLAKAIRVYTADFQDKHSDYEVILDLQEDGTRLSEPVCLALYRVYQEGLNNIVRHAGANKIMARLTLSPQELVFEIQDNGKGFAQPDNMVSLTQKGHYGLAGMRERIEAIHGRLEIISAPNQGATLKISVPWSAAAKESIR